MNNTKALNTVPEAACQKLWCEKWASTNSVLKYYNVVPKEHVPAGGDLP